MSHGTTAMEDTKKPNHVHVTIDSSGTLNCDPNPLPADGKDIKLKFVLLTDGYVFPQEKALVVANPGVEFPEPSKTPSDTIATLFDRNTGPGSFTYTVTVQKVSTGELLRHDPLINNGP